MKIDVSVIIPLFNRKDLISYTLASLIPVKHPKSSLEVIVVDDGSTDGGYELVQRDFPEVRLFSQCNSGAPAARNLGLKNALGKYILYLDSDDLIEENFFYKKILFLDSNPEVAGVYGLWEHFSSERRFAPGDIIPRAKHYPLDIIPDWKSHLCRSLEGWYIPSHAVLWRKETLLQINGHKETLKVNQDVDLMFRVLSNRYLIAGGNYPKALIREHEGEGRVGTAKDFQKINCIYELRVEFLKVLNKNGILDKETRDALGTFCFNKWVQYRRSFPILAEKFYALMKEINPQLKISGGFWFVCLLKAAGPRRSILLKDKFIQLLNFIK